MRPVNNFAKLLNLKFDETFIVNLLENLLLTDKNQCWYHLKNTLFGSYYWHCQMQGISTSLLVPLSYTLDAFSVNWSDFKCNNIPPFSLIGKILQKLKDDQVSKAIIVVAKWATQPCYTMHYNSIASASNFKSTLFSSQQSVTSSKQKKKSIRLYSIRKNLKSKGLTEKFI